MRGDGHVMSVVRPVRLIGTLTFLMLSITVAAHAEELRPETVWIPMTDHDSAGAAYELHLEATLYRPSKPEPFPVLLFNHGSTGGMRRLPTKTLRYPSVAQFFVERGFAVMIPMRRGRGASEGEYGELSGCTPVVLSGGVERGIADVEPALTFLRKQSWAIRRGSCSEECPAAASSRSSIHPSIQSMREASSTSPADGRPIGAIPPLTRRCLDAPAGRRCRCCGCIPRTIGTTDLPQSALTTVRSRVLAGRPSCSCIRRSALMDTIYCCAPSWCGNRPSMTS